MSLIRLAVFGVIAVFLAGCGKVAKEEKSVDVPQGSSGPGGPLSLVEARKGFKTKLVQPPPEKEPVDEPPAKVFSKVKYDSPVGKLWAYLTPDAKDGKKKSAIIWITGGDCNSIGECWKPAPANNDQSAAQYRQAGIVMMFPSLRGGNDNPGTREGFLGEVDDVLAATDFLAKQPHIDPSRIYLGGHSTGGTLVLLVSECSDRFRAVFSFGPVDDVEGYGDKNIWTPFDFRNPKELELRSPGRWLGFVKSPTYVFEGTRQGNIESLQNMARSTKNPNVQFFPVQGADHFSVLAPMNRLIASKILTDEGAKANITFTQDEINAAVRKK